MSRDPTTTGLGRDKLKKILHICSEGDADGKEISLDEQRSELLLDWLAKPIPLDKPDSKVVPENLSKLCDISGLLSSDRLKDLIFSPETDISLLNKVKEYYKDLSNATNSKTEHDVATAIYYAAIASMLVFHDIKATTFSYKDLEKWFVVFSRKKWITKSLADLFERAYQHCKKSRPDG